MNKWMRLWKLRFVFVEIERCMDKVSNVSFSKVEKNKNEMASVLAIAGIKRSDMFKAWW